MPVVPIYLNIDDKTYADVMNGTLELCGLAKNAGNKRVVKHIPTVADAAKDGAMKAIDFVREHKNETLIFGGILIAGGTVVGVVSYVSHRKQKKLNQQVGEALQAYLDAARGGKLTLETLNFLIESIEAAEKANPNGSINLNISSSQFGELIHCIFDYTIRLAEANNFNVQAINHPRYFKKKPTDDLKYYLNMQKQIFEQVA